MESLVNMEPLLTKVKPFFLLVEMVEDPEKRERAEIFLLAWLRYLHNRLYRQKGIPVFVGIYPFGTHCNPESVFPEDLTAFNPRELEGMQTIAPGEIFGRLHRDLSRSGKMDFPAVTQMPSILLISNCDIRLQEMEALENNNWFRHGRRAVFTYDPIESSPFTEAFCSGAPVSCLPDQQTLSREGVPDPFPEICRQKQAYSDFVDSLTRDSGSAEDLVTVDPVPPEAAPWFGNMGEAIAPDDSVMGVMVMEEEDPDGLLFDDDWS